MESQQFYIKFGLGTSMDVWMRIGNNAIIIIFNAYLL